MAASGTLKGGEAAESWRRHGISPPLQQCRESERSTRTDNKNSGAAIGCLDLHRLQFDVHRIFSGSARKTRRLIAHIRRINVHYIIHPGAAGPGDSGEGHNNSKLEDHEKQHNNSNNGNYNGGAIVSPPIHASATTIARSSSTASNVSGGGGSGGSAILHSTNKFHEYVIDALSDPRPSASVSPIIMSRSNSTNLLYNYSAYNDPRHHLHALDQSYLLPQYPCKNRTFSLLHIHPSELVDFKLPSASNMAADSLKSSSEPSYCSATTTAQCSSFDGNGTATKEMHRLSLDATSRRGHNTAPSTQPDRNGWSPNNPKATPQLAGYSNPDAPYDKVDNDDRGSSVMNHDHEPKRSSFSSNVVAKLMGLDVDNVDEDRWPMDACCAQAKSEVQTKDRCIDVDMAGTRATTNSARSLLVAVQQNTSIKEEQPCEVYHNHPDKEILGSSTPNYYRNIHDHQAAAASTSAATYSPTRAFTNRSDGLQLECSSPEYNRIMISRQHSVQRQLAGRRQSEATPLKLVSADPMTASTLMMCTSTSKRISERQANRSAAHNACSSSSNVIVGACGNVDGGGGCGEVAAARRCRKLIHEGPSKAAPTQASPRTRMRRPCEAGGGLSTTASSSSSSSCIYECANFEDARSLRLTCIPPTSSNDRVDYRISMHARNAACGRGRGGAAPLGEKLQPAHTSRLGKVTNVVECDELQDERRRRRKMMMMKVASGPAAASVVVEGKCTSRAWGISAANPGDMWRSTAILEKRGQHSPRRFAPTSDQPSRRAAGRRGGCCPDQELHCKVDDTEGTSPPRAPLVQMRLQRGGETPSEDGHSYWSGRRDKIGLDRRMPDVHDSSAKASSFTVPQQFLVTCIDEKRIMGPGLEQTIVGNDASQSHHPPTNYTDTQQQIWTPEHVSHSDDVASNVVSPSVILPQQCPDAGASGYWLESGDVSVSQQTVISCV